MNNIDNKNKICSSNQIKINENKLFKKEKIESDYIINSLNKLQKTIKYIGDKDIFYMCEFLDLLKLNAKKFIIYGGQSRKFIGETKKIGYYSETTINIGNAKFFIDTNTHQDSDFLFFNILEEKIKKIHEVVCKFFLGFPVQEIKLIKISDSIYNIKIIPTDLKYKGIDLTFRTDAELPYDEIRQAYYNSVMFQIEDNENYVIFPKILINESESLSLSEFLDLRQQETATGCSVEQFNTFKNSSSLFVYLYIMGYGDPLELIHAVAQKLTIEELIKFRRHVPSSMNIPYLLYGFSLIYATTTDEKKREDDWLKLYSYISSLKKDREFIEKNKDFLFFKNVEKLNDNLQTFKEFHNDFLLSLIMKSKFELRSAPTIQIRFQGNTFEIRAIGNAKIPSPESGCYHFLFTTQQAIDLYYNSLIKKLSQGDKISLNKYTPGFLSTEQFILLLLNRLMESELDCFPAMITLFSQIECHFDSLNSEETEQLSQISKRLLPIFLSHATTSEGQESLVKITQSKDEYVNLIFKITSLNKLNIPYIYKDLSYNPLSLLLKLINIYIEDHKVNYDEKLDFLIRLYLENLEPLLGIQQLISQTHIDLTEKLKRVFHILNKINPSLKNIPFIKKTAEILLKNKLTLFWENWLTAWSKTLKFAEENSIKKSVIDLKTFLDDVFSVFCFTQEKLEDYREIQDLFFPYYLQNNDSLIRKKELLDEPFFSADQKIFWTLMTLEKNPLPTHWPIIKKMGEDFIQIQSNLIDKPKNYVIDFSLNCGNEKINPVIKLCEIWSKIIQLQSDENILKESEILFEKMLTVFNDNALENKNFLLSWILDCKITFKNKKIIPISDIQTNDSVIQICKAFKNCIEPKSFTMESLNKTSLFLTKIDAPPHLSSLIIRTQIFLFKKWLAREENTLESLILADQLQKKVIKIDELDREDIQEVSELYLNFTRKFIENAADKNALEILLLIDPQNLRDELKGSFQAAIKNFILKSIESKELFKTKELIKHIELTENNEDTDDFIQSFNKRILKQQWSYKEGTNLISLYHFFTPFLSQITLHQLAPFFFTISTNFGIQWVIENQLTDFSKLYDFFIKAKFPEELCLYLLKTIPLFSSLDPNDIQIFFDICIKKLNEKKICSNTLEEFFTHLEKINSKIKYYSKTGILIHELIMLNNQIKKLGTNESAADLNLLKDILSSIQKLEVIENTTIQKVIIEQISVVTTTVFAHKNIKDYEVLLEYCLNKHKKGESNQLVQFFDKVIDSQLSRSDPDQLFDICYHPFFTQIPKPLMIKFLEIALKTSPNNFNTCAFIIFVSYDLIIKNVDKKIEAFYGAILLKILDSYHYAESQANLELKKQVFALVHKLLNKNLDTKNYEIFFRFLVFNLIKGNVTLDSYINIGEIYKNTVASYCRKILIDYIKYLDNHPLHLTNFYEKLFIFFTELYILTPQCIISSSFVLLSIFNFKIETKKNEIYQTQFDKITISMMKNITKVLSNKSFPNSFLIKSKELLLFFENKIKLKKELITPYKELFLIVCKKLSTYQILNPIEEMNKLTDKIFKENILDFSEYLEAKINLCKSLLTITDLEEIVAAFNLIFSILYSLQDIVEGEENKEKYIDFVNYLIPQISSRIYMLPKKGFNGVRRIGMNTKVQFSNEIYCTPVDLTVFDTSQIDLTFIPTHESVAHLFTEPLKNNFSIFLTKIKFLSSHQLELMLQCYADFNNFSSDSKHTLEYNISRVRACEEIIRKGTQVTQFSGEARKQSLSGIIYKKTFDELLSELDNTDFQYIEDAMIEISNLELSQLNDQERNLIFTYLISLVQTNYLLNLEQYECVGMIYAKCDFFVGFDVSEINKIKKEFEIYLAKIKSYHEKFANDVFAYIKKRCVNANEKIEVYVNYISALFDDPNNFNSPTEPINFRPFSKAIDLILEMLCVEELSEGDQFLFIKKTLRELYNKLYISNAKNYDTWLYCKYFAQCSLLAFPLPNKYFYDFEYLQIRGGSNNDDDIKICDLPDEIRKKIDSFFLLLLKLIFTYGTEQQRSISNIFTKLNKELLRFTKLKYFSSEKIPYYFGFLRELIALIKEDYVDDVEQLQKVLLELLDTQALSFFLNYDFNHKFRSKCPKQVVSKYLSIIKKIRDEIEINQKILDLLILLLVSSIYPLKLEFSSEMLDSFALITHFIIDHMSNERCSYSLVKAIFFLIENLKNHEDYSQLLNSLTKILSKSVLLEPIKKAIPLIKEAPLDLDAYYNLSKGLINVLNGSPSRLQELIGFIMHTSSRCDKDDCPQFTLLTNQILMRLIESDQKLVYNESKKKNNNSVAQQEYEWSSNSSRKTEEEPKILSNDITAFINKKYFPFLDILKKNSDNEIYKERREQIEFYGLCFSFNSLDEDDQKMLIKQINCEDSNLVIPKNCLYINNADTVLFPDEEKELNSEDYQLIKIDNLCKNWNNDYLLKAEKEIKKINMIEVPNEDREIIFNKLEQFIEKSLLNNGDPVYLWINNCTKFLQSKECIYSENEKKTRLVMLKTLLEKLDENYKNLAKRLIVFMDSNAIKITSYEKAALYSNLILSLVDNPRHSYELSFRFVIFLIRRGFEKHNFEFDNYLINFTLEKLFSKSPIIEINENYNFFINYVKFIFGYYPHKNFENGPRVKHLNWPMQLDSCSTIMPKNFSPILAKKCDNLTFALLRYFFESHSTQQHVDTNAFELIKITYEHIKTLNIIFDPKAMNSKIDSMLTVLILADA